MLAKKTAADYDTQWVAAGGGGAVAGDLDRPGSPTPGAGYDLWIDTDEAAPGTLHRHAGHVASGRRLGRARVPERVVNYGAPFSNASFRKFPDGKVRLKGNVKSAARTPVIFMLPAGYRPPAATNFVVNGSGAFARIEVDPDGSVYALTASNTTIFLDSVEFDTEAVLQVATLAAQPLDAIHLVGAAGEPAVPAAAGWTLRRQPRSSSARAPTGRVRLSGQS